MNFPKAITLTYMLPANCLHLPLLGYVSNSKIIA